ncbi:hypothetical protein D3C80_1548870 [compost metagenome]
MDISFTKEELELLSLSENEKIEKGIPTVHHQDKLGGLPYGKNTLCPTCQKEMHMLFQFSSNPDVKGHIFMCLNHKDSISFV